MENRNSKNENGGTRRFRAPRKNKAEVQGEANGEVKQEKPRKQPKPIKQTKQEKQQKKSAAPHIHGGKKPKRGGKPVKIIFLGGVGEIGKNMTAIECGDDIIIIDAGAIFPTEETPGIDLIVPDITYFVENKRKVRGLVLTH